MAQVATNKIRDTAPVASVARTPLVLVVNPSFPAKSVPELIAYAKASPGKINMATAGIGSSLHLAGELFMTMSGVKLVPVHYRGLYVPTCLPDGCNWHSVRYPRRSSRSGRASCAPLW